MPLTQILGPAGAFVITVDGEDFRLPLISSGSTSRPAATADEIRFVNELLDPVQQRVTEAPPGSASWTYRANADEAVEALYRLERSNEVAAFKWVTNAVKEHAEGAAASTVAVATPTAGNKSVATFAGASKADLESVSLRGSKGRFLIVDGNAFGIHRITDSDKADVYLRGPVAANVCTPSTSLGKISAAIAANATWSIVTPARVISFNAQVTAAGNHDISPDATEDTLELSLSAVAERVYWVAESQNLAV